MGDATCRLLAISGSLRAVSPRSTFAVASLGETITVMSAKLVKEAHVIVQMTGRALPDGRVVADNDLAPVIREAIAHFVKAIKDAPTEA